MLNPDLYYMYVSYWTTVYVYILTDLQFNRLVYANAGKINDVPSIGGI